MATINERFWESKSRIRKVWIIRFCGPDGKRTTQSYPDEEAARMFFEGILKREVMWKAAHELARLDETFKQSGQQEIHNG
jgi:hypothetical protein